jgi:hypothetical protein
MRSQEQILAVEQKLFDLVWHNRHPVYKQKMADGLESKCDPKGWKRALAATKRIERGWNR